VWQAVEVLADVVASVGIGLAAALVGLAVTDESVVAATVGEGDDAPLTL